MLVLRRAANGETFPREMTIEGKSTGNKSAAHAIEARDIDQAQPPAAGNSPLGKGALELVFTNNSNGGQEPDRPAMVLGQIWTQSTEMGKSDESFGFSDIRFFSKRQKAWLAGG